MNERRPYVTMPLDLRRVSEPGRIERALFELFVTFHRVHGIEPSTKNTYVYSKEIERWNVQVSLTIADADIDITALFPNVYYVSRVVVERWVTVMRNMEVMKALS